MAEPDWSAFARILSGREPEDFLQDVSRRRFGLDSGNEDVEAIPEEDLSKADRYSHAATVADTARDIVGEGAPLVTLPLVAAGFTGYEALKGLGGPAVLNALSSLHPEFAAGANTSPASLGNVEAPLRGYVDAEVKHYRDNPERAALTAAAVVPGLQVAGALGRAADDAGILRQVAEAFARWRSKR